MRSIRFWTLALLAIVLTCTSAGFVPPATAEDDDPDLPRGIAAVDKELAQTRIWEKKFNLNTT